MSGITEERTVHPAQTSVPSDGFRYVRGQISAILVLATSFWACAGESTQQGESGVTVRDSAGITIVENHTPAWGVDQGWNFAEEPDLTIGVLDGLAEYTFDVPRPYGLSDGRILVMDFGTHDLRYYSPTGEHIRTVGGEGSGPGEFERLGNLFVGIEDTVFVFDPSLARMTVFDELGDLVRVVTLERPAESIGMDFAGLLDNGLWSIGTEFRGADSAGLGIRRSEVALLAVDGSRQTVLDTLTTIIQLTSETGSPRVTLMVVLPFEARGQAAAGGDHVYVTDGDEFEIRVYSLTGRLERIIRLDQAPAFVTDDDITEYMKRLADQFERWNTPVEFQSAFREVNEDATGRSTRMPAISSMKIGPSGHLLVIPWSMPWNAPWEPVPDTKVFDADGRWLGDIQLPEGHTVTYFGEDYALATWKDELEVSFVRRFQLKRSE